jgi:rhodanese-related sulfurtransferase
MGRKEIPERGILKFKNIRMNMKPRIILAIILLTMGFIIAAVPQNRTKRFQLTADELLAEVNTRTQFITPDVVADMIVKKDPTLRLIDVRGQDEFEKFSLPGAINIPITDLLSDKHAEILNQDLTMNVLYSNGTLIANEAWMITRQLGYTNNYVLEGGLNYWMEAIMNPQKPSAFSPDEEFARYDFRRSAGMALGAGAPVASQKESQAQKPVVKPVAKKKKAAGGC